MTREIENDGFVTPEYALQHTSFNPARPATPCTYPHCEGCRNYISFRGEHYCDVPMVVSKQIWHMTAEKLRKMEQRLTEIENLVTDEILGIREGVE